MCNSIVLICGCLAATAVQGADDGPRSRYEKQHALVVGINYGGLDNKGFIPKLKNAEDDARAVHKALIDGYGYAPADATLLLGAEATKEAVEAALARITGRAGAWDSFLFYFSGHGETGKDPFDQDYAVLVPFDARSAGAGKGVDRGSAVDFDDIVLHHLARGVARHSLVVLDCCYSGRVFGDGGHTRGLRVDRDFDAEAFRARGVQALSAGLATQRVPDGDGGHSPFTASLLAALRAVPTALRPDQPAYTAEYLALRVAEGLDGAIRAGRPRPQFGYAPIKGNSQTANFHLFPVAEARRRPAADAPAPPEAVALRFDLHSMPGLSGQWWFEETPWLIPSIRARLALDTELSTLRAGLVPEALASRGPAWAGSAFLDPDTRRVHALLRSKVAEKGLLDAADPGTTLAKELLDDPSKGSEADLEGYLKELDASIRRADGPRPFDRHLAAVLKHRLDRPDAAEGYHAAIADYEAAEREQPGLKTLRALCRSDLARLLLAKRRFEAAARELSAVEALLGGQPTALQLDGLCNRGEALRRLGRWRESEECLARAVELAGTHLAPTHPLRAYALEKAAWTAFDRWRLREAIRGFEQAHLALEDPSALGDQALVTRLRVIHGRAMAERYAGRLEVARGRFLELEAEIRRALADREQAGALSPGFGRLLADRLVNTMERRADSHLFCGEPAAAAEVLDDALEGVDALAADLRDPTRFRLHAKRAAACALLGDRPEDLDRALRALGTQRLVMDEFRDLKPVADLAEALTAHARGDRGKALRAYLDAATRADALATTGRDGLEMILLAAATLGDSAAEPPTRLALGVVHQGKDPSVRAFVRRYQDALIPALAARADDAALARWVLATKLGDQAPSLAALSARPTLVVHAGPARGVAILLRPSAPPIVSTFEQGTASWVARSSPAPWSKPLADALKALEGPVTVYWSDPIADLNDEGYPFDTPPKDRRVHPAATPPG